MERFQGLLGIVLILGIAFLFSNNRKKINVRLVVSGLLLQIVIAVSVLKIPPVTWFFQQIGGVMQKIEMFAKDGASFVFRGVQVGTPTGVIDYSQGGFVFAFSVTATIILVCALIEIFYFFGLMQRLVNLIAKGMKKIMPVSGAEALSNVASAFVGQVEAQMMIRPYLPTMTRSELIASMSGSLACIAGGILIVYVNMGAKAEYLLAASLMAAPGALVISKILYPETEESATMGSVKLEVKSQHSNVIDAISHGASVGMKISINVIAMLIGFIAIISLINYLLGLVIPGMSLDVIFGTLFYPMAYAMGVPVDDVANSATLLGQKLTINEFFAFQNLTSGAIKLVSEKGIMITSIAICGFANFSSVGMQIGGIGEMVPERRAELAKLGMRALVAGTLASYLSATLAGILM